MYSGIQGGISGAYPSNIKEIYKIESTIGKGSFATVKKAKHRETG